LLPALAMAMIAVVIVTAQPWRNEAERSVVLVEEIVALTQPGEPVMDLKGETVFRQRPFYFVLEAVTNVKLRFGQIRDTIADALGRSGINLAAGRHRVVAHEKTERPLVVWSGTLRSPRFRSER